MKIGLVVRPARMM